MRRTDLVTADLVIALGALALLCSTGSASADATAEEIARLGQDLTPLGAEKAGNADGAIPAWDGGIVSPPAGYAKGAHHADPYGADQPLLRIDRSNMAQHADRLTAGHKAMLETYDSFFMNVYPTRRSASVPQRIYDKTREIAATAALSDGGNGVTGAINGYPFPFPKQGVEVIWNHILRYQGDAVARYIGQAAPTRDGDFTLVQFEDEVYKQYSHAGMTPDRLGNVIAFFLQEVVAPPRLAGTILLVHETLDQAKEHRKAWIYNPGQRRVRRAPNVAFDNPGTAADGQRTSDQFDLFNGSPERYDWKLIGKKEMYIPYNSYRLHDGALKYTDIVKPLHVNPELLRYELHRVWVVEATLKEGTRHVYKRRTFYVDEDSWQIAVVDQYDNRDQLWRVSEGHPINYYEVPTFWYTLEVHYDLQSGRYLAIGLDNETRMYDFDIQRAPDDYTVAALRRKGQR